MKKKKIGIGPKQYNPKSILRILVDPQNDVPAEKSRLIKYCKCLLSSAKWETTHFTKWIYCKYLGHFVCFRTYSNHLSTNRLPAVYLLFVKL